MINQVSKIDKLLKEKELTAFEKEQLRLKREILLKDKTVRK